MLSLLNILQLEMHIFPAAVIIMLLLPFTSKGKLRYYGCFAVYIASVMAVSLLMMPIFLFRLKNVRNCVWASHILKHVTKIVGIRWELRGDNIIREDRGAVVVANHQSMFDILGLFNFWHIIDKCAVVAKKQLFYVWPFGLSAWMAGVVFIDRDKGRKANQQLDEASYLTSKKQTKLWLFPEGTRNHNPESLLPFKRGAFRVAIECQVPVIPIVYSPYFFINSKKKYFGQGKIIIQVLDPIPTLGKTEKDVDKLMEETRDKMVTQYEMLKQEVLKHADNENKDMK